MAVSRKQLKAALLPSGALVLGALLGGCADTPPLRQGDAGTPAHMPAPRTKPALHPPIAHELPALPRAASGRGGYYKDDGPGESPPPNLRDTPDAEVRAEPLSRWANRPYVVFGKSYTPMPGDLPFAQRGMGSWYGKKFHGQKTSSGEIYDMYKMTAAHPTLPIPSYARITHVGTGKQVTVRVNDRGPFHAGRIVDLSYTAALKLGLLSAGSQEVHLERLLPDGVERLATRRRNAPEPVDSKPPRPESPDDIAALLLTSKAEAKAIRAHAGEPVLMNAATAAPAASTAAAAATPAAAGGFYVQLGAFSRAAKAEEIRARIAGNAWGGAAPEVVVAGALHRVLGGPFTTRAEALEAARAVPPALGLKPIVIQR